MGIEHHGGRASRYKDGWDGWRCSWPSPASSSLLRLPWLRHAYSPSPSSTCCRSSIVVVVAFFTLAAVAALALAVAVAPWRGHYRSKMHAHIPFGAGGLATQLTRTKCGRNLVWITSKKGQIIRSKSIINYYLPHYLSST